MTSALMITAHVNDVVVGTPYTLQNRTIIKCMLGFSGSLRVKVRSVLYHQEVKIDEPVLP